MNNPDPSSQRRGRLKLLLVFAVFAAPAIAALVLTVTGWQPSGKAHGLPITPQRNFVDEQLPVTLADGRTYAWRDSQPRLTLVALAGPDCAAHCLDTLTKMAAARITLGRNVDRLRLLYLGTPPTDVAQDGMRNYWQLGRDSANRLGAYRPATPDSVSAVLVESDGTALAYYPAGFDASGLRQDLQKVIR